MAATLRGLATGTRTGVVLVLRRRAGSSFLGGGSFLACGSFLLGGFDTVAAMWNVTGAVLVYDSWGTG